MGSSLWNLFNDSLPVANEFCLLCFCVIRNSNVYWLMAKKTAIKRKVFRLPILTTLF